MVALPSWYPAGGPSCGFVADAPAMLPDGFVVVAGTPPDGFAGVPATPPDEAPAGNEVAAPLLPGPPLDPADAFLSSLELQAATAASVTSAAAKTAEVL